MESLLQDLSFAFRQIRKHPGFVILAVITLGFGIGANATVFALANKVFLHPLPFPDAGQLMEVLDIQPGYSGLTRVSVPEFQDWEREGAYFQALLAQVRGGANLRSEGAVERVSVVRLAGDYLGVLGLDPAFGRAFTREELESSNRVAMVSEGFWQRQFAGEPDVVGKVVELDGQTYTVIGVMPEAGHRVASLNTVAWIPLTQEDYAARGHFLRVFGRLQPGIALREAEERTQAMATALQESEGTEHGIRIESLENSMVGRAKAGALLLLGAAIAVLLIICGNLASLFLARSMARHQEFAVRSAMGARGPRLGRQVLTETGLIGLLGGVVGLALAYVATKLLAGASPDVASLMIKEWMDYRVVAFTFAVALGAGLFFGLTPALGLRRQGLAQVLKEGEGTRAGGGRGALRKRRYMVAAQMAFSFVLLASATLLLRSLVNVLHEDPGVDQEGLLLFRVALPQSSYPDSGSLNVFHRQLAERLMSVPGVDAVSGGSILPLSGGVTNGTFSIEGREWPAGENPYVNKRDIRPGFFKTLGISIQRGREFTEADGVGATRVTVISADMAEQYWPGSDPLGQRIRVWGPPAEIVGIVAEVSQTGLGEPPQLGTAYVPMSQGRQGRYSWIILKTRGDPLSLVDGARTEVASLDPGLPLFSVTTMEEVINRSLADRRITVNLFLAFGLGGLLLAGVGVFGVTAHTVQRRTREIGVRMALGAGGGSMVRMVLIEEMRVLGTSLLAGLLLALGLSRVLSSSLVGVSPNDPLAYGATLAVLGGVGFLAVLIPASRAARVDPISALRAE